MKNPLRLFALFAAFSALSASAQFKAGAPFQPRIMSYNVRHCEGMDLKLDIARTASVIKAENPDVCAIQELDSMTKRGGMVNQVEMLGRETLMHALYAATIPYQGGKYGIGMLCKEKPIKVTRTPLPGGEPRMLLVAEFERYCFACTHLDLTEKHRLESLPILIAAAQATDKPFIIAGDFNDEPDSEFIKAFMKDFDIHTSLSTKTFPADKPDITIDYIATYKRDKSIALSRKVCYEPNTSDHRPVVVDLRLKAKSNEIMVRPPYLQDPRPTQMTVMQQTENVANCWVEYGEDSLNTKRVRAIVDGQQVCYDIENKIVLDGLKPATDYYYRVCAVDIMEKHAYHFTMGDTVRSRFYHFKTPGEKSEDFTCIVFNDLHENAETFDNLCKLTSSTAYDFIVFNGDCLPEPLNREHAIRMIHNLTDKVNGAEHPVIFIRGNHEIRNFYSAGMHSLIGYRNDKTYGAFNWGDTRFVTLDCGEDKLDSDKEYAGFNDFNALRETEAKFIAEEVKSKDFKKAARRILICHIPLFGNGDRYKPCTEMWGPVIKGKPFDLAMFAHTHSFVFKPEGIEGSGFPIYNGGGPNPKKATAAILEKRGKKLHLKVVSQDPAQCIEKDL